MNLETNRERLSRFLNPGSIAVVGGTESERVLQQSQKLGYAGPMWAVNPHRNSLAGIPCLHNISALPEVPDAVFVGVPAEPTIDIVRQLSNMGVGGAVCLASGFREVGDAGHSRQHKLRDAAADMPVLGPNCYGFINTLLGAALFPDQHGLGRNEYGVAIISSSGNIGINFTFQQRGLPIAWLITVGNQAVIGIEEAMAAALENPQIRAIGLHMEGLRNLPMFIKLMEIARIKRIPVIVLKTGKSDIGARITLSHTATLAGESRLYEALFARLGVGQVDTVEDFLEALHLACIHGPLQGNRIASMSCSGGEASLIADLSVGRSLQFPAIESEHRKLLKKTLNEYVMIDNPLDYHTFIWGDHERTFQTFSAMMKGSYDLVLLIIDFPVVNNCDAQDWINTAEAFVDACRSTGSKGAVVTCLTENYSERISQYLIDNGVTPLHGMRQALSAIEAVSRAGMAWDHEFLLPELSLICQPPAATEVSGVDEHIAKLLLKEFAVQVPDGEQVTSVDMGLQAAQRIGYPVVVKAVSAQVAHKSDMDAVAVGIMDSEECENETRRLLKISGAVLIEKMVQNTVVEMLVGVSYDEMFGHYLILGCGGTLVELIDDSLILLFPVTRPQIQEALQQLKIWPLLNGFRGRPRADINAVVKTIISISRLIQARRQDIVELEINPLMVLPTGSGAVAADALVRIKPQQLTS